MTLRRFYQYSDLTGQKFERMSPPVMLFLISLFGGRWISYIGLPSTPIFFLDIAFVVFGCIYSLKGWFFYEKKGGVSKRYANNQITVRVTNILLLLVFVFILFQIIRMYSYPIFLVIRDCVPFFYPLLAVGIAKEIKHQSIEQLFKWIVIVGILHCLWSIPTAIGIIQPIHLGGIFKQPLFDFRPDQTAIVISMTIIAAFNLLGKSIAVFFNSFLLGTLPFLSLLLHSRASFLAIMTSFTIGLILLKRQGKKSSFAKFALFSFILLMTSILLAISSGIKLPANSVVYRMGLIQGADSYFVEQAYWTKFGREQGQEKLIEWIKDNNYYWLGAGPGSEMMLESGAIKYLSGDPTVRSPHSWPVSAFSRFGMIGLILWFLMCCSILWGKVKTVIQRDFVSLYLALIPILIVSQFGVVMEAPFGLIPFVSIMALIRSRLINSV